MPADVRMEDSTSGSSGSETNSGKADAPGRSQAKKRRIPGACDLCKRKKIRCDSGELSGNRCSNCMQSGLECTHKQVTKTLGSAKGYVESLEARLEKMDKLLRKLLPGTDLDAELKRPAGNVAHTPRPLLCDDEETELLGKFTRLTLNPKEHRFFGRSSQYELLQTALDLREEFTGEGIAYVQSALPMKRPEFWDVPNWMSYNPEMDEEEREYSFPDDDLYPILVDAYFSQINPFLPLLHRPTFLKQLKDGLHLKDSMFARVFLLVCAHGARYSDDPRIHPEGTASTRSAGWRWFEQVNVLRRNLFNRTVLHELQMHALYVLFASSSETPQGVWAQIGLALRLSQEVGGHRRRNRDTVSPTIEDELWKRAFWVILTLDRLISSGAGRPCGLQDEDFDLDLPLEVDDDYWAEGFTQPEGQPSSVAYFNCYLGLMDILAYAMRLIYSSKHSKYAHRATKLSGQEIIAELDTAMNTWMDSVPEHLRWNTGAKPRLFLKQSSALHATYYHIQIFIHRPFIPSPRNPIPTAGAFPSLAICTNAARSCCHVLEAFTKLSPLPFQPFQTLAFTAALILLLNIWSGKRSGFAPNPKREMEDVQRCLNMLKTAELRSASAGRFVDLLTEVASAGDIAAVIQQSEQRSPNTKKRTRSTTRESSGEQAATLPSSSPTLHPIRTIAGTRRVSLSQKPAPAVSPTQSPVNFLLPMYGNDLGRLPVYGQFNFADPSTANNFGGLPLRCTRSAGEVAGESHHFEQALESLPPNIMTLTSDPASELFVTSSLDTYAFDGMLKDAILNGELRGSPLNTAIAAAASPPSNATNAQGASGSSVKSTAPPPPARMSPADIASLIAQCSGVDYSALLQQLSSLSHLQSQESMLDTEMMKMWDTAPANLELDEWGSFISNLGELTQSARPNETGNDDGGATSV